MHNQLMSRRSQTTSWLAPRALAKQHCNNAKNREEVARKNSLVSRILFNLEKGRVRVKHVNIFRSTVPEIAQ
jgi:hypothetical protein